MGDRCNMVKHNCFPTIFKSSFRIFELMFLRQSLARCAGLLSGGSGCCVPLYTTVPCALAHIRPPRWVAHWVALVIRFMDLRMRACFVRALTHFSYSSYQFGVT